MGIGLDDDPAVLVRVDVVGLENESLGPSRAEFEIVQEEEEVPIARFGEERVFGRVGADYLEQPLLLLFGKTDRKR